MKTIYKISGIITMSFIVVIAILSINSNFLSAKSSVSSVAHKIKSVAPQSTNINLLKNPPSTLINGSYAIKSVATDKFLDADWNEKNYNGCKIQLWHATGQLNQLWSFTSLSTTVPLYKITLYGTEMCLDAACLYTNGCNVRLWEYYGAENQKWFVQSAGNNQYLLCPSFDPYRPDANVLVLDADQPNLDRDGCKVQLWKLWNGANQKWILAPVN
jgi:hypothetical protein